MDVDYSICNGQLNGIWVGGNFTRAGGGSAWNIAFWAASGGYWDVPATATIVSRLNGAVFQSPASVLVSADFAASGCGVAGVGFCEGNILLATDATAPFSFTWNSVPSGTHSLTAVATDNIGNVTRPDAVSFKVNMAPSVSMTSPAPYEVFSAPASITLSAAASDTDGNVVKVEFYANGGLLGTDTVAPFSLVWQNVSAGSYTLTAKATDNDGGVKTSAGVPITVQ